MAHLRAEVDGDVQDIGPHLLQAVTPVEHVVCGIDDAPCDERIKDTGEPFAEERGDCSGNGQQEIARNHDEKRD